MELYVQDDDGDRSLDAARRRISEWWSTHQPGSDSQYVRPGSNPVILSEPDCGG